MIKNAIVLVPFPFDDFSTLKVRPALCLTSEIGSHEHVIIAFISSKISDDLLASDVLVRRTSNYWIRTGLSVDSVIRLHKIVTIPKSLIKRKLGTINEELKMLVCEKIKQLFDK
ncbi:MAG: type II toxin-antitoxin system PemK/MazF family toxin [Ekhidna sp.]|nr:type II toxin-antitoxin system PemK/MazF family toxin [Ekhidna sp.]